MLPYKWQFAPRFRRNAFGWQSDTPIQRIKEALVEIKAVAKKEPVLAAEGAVLFLEKLAPAIDQVDSSSGSIGGAVNHAIETLVPIIAKAGVNALARQRLLERLWTALYQDAMPYLELMGDCWGELCASPEIASRWADDLMPTVKNVWADDTAGHHGFFKGTTACLSALYAARRYDELLTLLESSRRQEWYYRCWGAKALAVQGKHAEAIQYAEDSRHVSTPVAGIARFCEALLLDSGFADEAYARYAVDATWASTNLARFRAIAKKYPQVPPETILRDLVARDPGQEGKWFAAAKDAGLFDLAIELANRSPADPRTLIRAARDFSLKRPDFAMAAGMTALHGMILGYGYEINRTDVLDAYAAVMQAAAEAGTEEASIKADMRALLADKGTGGAFVQRVLAPHLAAGAIQETR
ncbi:MAG: hypothetical protein V4724_14465 [Pseudomonadota bacterium]